MKLYSDPGRIVQKRVKGQFGFKIVPIFKFDENGMAEIDDTKFDDTDLNKFRAIFRSEPITNTIIEEKPIVDEHENIEVHEGEEEAQEKTEVHKCNKCDFETDNKGTLMAHYRKIHPKGGK